MVKNNSRAYPYPRPPMPENPSGDTGMGRGKSLQSGRPAPLHRVAEFFPTASKPKTKPDPAAFGKSAGCSSTPSGPRNSAEVLP